MRLKKGTILNEIVNKPKPLSASQKKAAISTSKRIRVIAGAGTGKTETLTRRIIYLLLYKKLEPKSIVAFTFTEKASQSMKTRIYERVKQLKGEEACAKLGEMYVGTIHGYCLQVLEDHFGYGDHDVLDENQEMAFILREGWSLGLGKGGKYSENCKNFLRSVNVVYDEILDRKKIGKKDEEFLRMLEKYESLLSKNRLLTFGRIISLAVENLEKAPNKLKHVKHLLVDEYQDINRLQERLIIITGKWADIFVVGDPRQSIYQWRGSDEKCFENFNKIFNNVKTVSIRENRRSAKELVNLANDFADTFESTKYDHLKPLKRGRGMAAISELETDEEEAKWIISQIDKHVNSGLCNFKDLSILLRSVTTSAEPFIQFLKDRSIPYIVGGKVGLFKREEAQALGRIFCWLWDEGFWVENPWNWHIQTSGNDLLETAITMWRNVTGINIRADKRKELIRWKKMMLKEKFENFTQAFHNVLVIMGFKKLNPDDRLHAALMANLGRFSTLLADYESSIRLGGRKPLWKDALKGLCWYINTYAVGAYEEQPSEDIRGVDAVQIMTIHQAKGLEWPVVFMPSLTARRFPSSNTGKKQEWFIPREMFEVQRYEGGIEDERRLFYVAITRAESVVCLTYFKKIAIEMKRSPFIEPILKHFKRITSNQGIPKMDFTLKYIGDELETFSAGEIITYLKCPYFFRLRGIWNYKPGLAEALGYGKSLHHCLRCASELIKEGENPSIAVKRMVDEKFHVPYLGGIEKIKLKKKAGKVLAEFVKKYEEDMGRIEGVEVRLEFPVQRATISGRADVILKEGGSMEVRDYKTSDEVTTKEEASMQLQLYAQGLRMIERPIDTASLAYLQEGKITGVDVKDDSLRTAVLTAENAIKGIKEGRYKAKPGEFCGKCDQREICRWCAK